LLNIVEGEGGAVRAQSPLLLMLVRGKVYLRMEHTQRSLTEIAQATQLLWRLPKGHCTKCRRLRPRAGRRKTLKTRSKDPQ